MEVKRMNISSIVVRTRAEDKDKLIDLLDAGDICEVHYHDDIGQIVVIIEGKDVSEEMAKLQKLEKTDYVMSANLFYTYTEEELANIMEEFKKAEGHVPDVLNSDLPAEFIKYSGNPNI
jgi:nitrate reductase NapD